MVSIASYSLMHDSISPCLSKSSAGYKPRLDGWLDQSKFDILINQSMNVVAHHGIKGLVANAVATVENFDG